jgi:hypothetical protein
MNSPIDDISAKRSFLDRGFFVGRVSEVIILGIATGATLADVVRQCGESIATVNDNILSLARKGFVTVDGKLTDSGYALLQLLKNGLDEDERE